MGSFPGYIQYIVWHLAMLTQLASTQTLLAGRMRVNKVEGI